MLSSIKIKQKHTQTASDAFSLIVLQRPTAVDCELT